MKLVLLIIFLIFIIFLILIKPFIKKNDLEVWINFLENNFSNLSRDLENARLRLENKKYEENSIIYKKNIENIKESISNINLNFSYDILPQNTMIIFIIFNVIIISIIVLIFYIENFVKSTKIGKFLFPKLSIDNYQEKINEINEKIKELNESIINRQKLKTIEEKNFEELSIKIESLDIQKINLNYIIKNLRLYESYKKVYIEYSTMLSNIQYLKLSFIRNENIFDFMWNTRLGLLHITAMDYKGEENNITENTINLYHNDAIKLITDNKEKINKIEYNIIDKFKEFNKQLNIIEINQLKEENIENINKGMNLSFHI